MADVVRLNRPEGAAPVVLNREHIVYVVHNHRGWVTVKLVTGDTLNVFFETERHANDAIKHARFFRGVTRNDNTLPGQTNCTL